MIRSAIGKIEGMIFATVFWWAAIMTALCVDMHKEKQEREKAEKEWESGTFNLTPYAKKVTSDDNH